MPAESSTSTAFNPSVTPSIYPCFLMSNYSVITQFLINLTNHRPIHLSIHHSTDLTIHLPTDGSTHPSIHSSKIPPIYVLVDLLISPFTHSSFQPAQHLAFYLRRVGRRVTGLQLLPMDADRRHGKWRQLSNVLRPYSIKFDSFVGNK